MAAAAGGALGQTDTRGPKRRTHAPTDGRRGGAGAGRRVLGEAPAARPTQWALQRPARGARQGRAGYRHPPSRGQLPAGHVTPGRAGEPGGRRTSSARDAHSGRAGRALRMSAAVPRRGPAWLWERTASFSVGLLEGTLRPLQRNMQKPEDFYSP